MQKLTATIAPLLAVHYSGEAGLLVLVIVGAPAIWMTFHADATRDHFNAQMKIASSESW